MSRKCTWFHPLFMRYTKPKIFWLGLTVGIIAVVVADVSLTSMTMDVPLFETPAWRSTGVILLRSEEEGKGALLLKHRERGAVYFYDPKTQNLSLVSTELWQKASGSIGNCELQVPPSPSKMDIDKSGKLRASDIEVATAGTTILDLRVSPSGNKVAVLSADGPKDGSILPFLGSGGVAGQHYHQLLSLPGAVPIGKPVRLPLESKKVGITVCWSPDERYVVYSDILYSHLSIVHVYTTRG